MERDPREILAEVVGASGLVDPPPEGSGTAGVALISGGPDSACLAAGLAGAVGAGGLLGLHLNYGLREDSGEDEATAARLCEELGIELVVERPRLGTGNLQAEARDLRYAAAQRLMAVHRAAWIATGHTRTDLAETVLYRLATSPGSRALLGMPPRSGDVIRPLLALGREQTRELATEAGLPFRDDPSNRDPRFARARVRHEVLPVLRELSPAAEEAIAATRAELAEERDALEAIAAEALAAAGVEAGATAIQAAALADLHPAVRRLALRGYAERVAGRAVPLPRESAETIWRLVRSPEGGEVDLGGGLRAVCEAGVVRVVAAPAAEPEPAQLSVPGACRFGHWRVAAELAAVSGPRGPEVATLDPAALGSRLEVRPWREGDRMRPLGLGGSKSLQDLFTDRRVPRSLRHELPVVLAGEEIAWVPGVAVSEEFRLTEGAGEAAVLTASRVD
jgi:tRNA(Ile)-lysidine synthase